MVEQPAAPDAAQPPRPWDEVRRLAAKGIEHAAGVPPEVHAALIEIHRLAFGQQLAALEAALDAPFTRSEAA